MKKRLLILMTVTGMIILLGGLLTYGLGVHEIIPVPRPDLIVVGTSLIGILLIVCTASPERIFRTASRSCTKFCTRKTVRLRSRATHTTLESTTLRWKSPSGGFSRTLIF